MMDPQALYDALNCASLSVIHAENGNRPKAEEAYFEASVAATGAFEEGSAEDAALNVVLGAVGALAQGCAA
jgi:hypothetical protein